VLLPFHTPEIEAGTDEAGRGCLAGPVTAAALILTTPKFIIVDGNRFKPYKNISYECIIKGDGKYLSIAGASVLAKTYRDDYMEKIHKEFPMYNWKKNKGYPTKEHRAAIRKYGITKYHRKSFRQLPEQLKLVFNTIYIHSLFS